MDWKIQHHKNVKSQMDTGFNSIPIKFSNIFVDRQVNSKTKVKSLEKRRVRWEEIVNLASVI